MSRNALILDKAESQIDLESQTRPAPTTHVPRSGEYLDLIHRLFRRHVVLAVVGTGSGARASEACTGIAAELASCGSRVVVVRVDSLLRASQAPDISERLPGNVPNVWVWPADGAVPVEFFPTTQSRPTESDWLGSLRREFDAVLLDCPSPGITVAAAQTAALADAAVLVVESGQTLKEQIQRDQHILELRGVKLAGCVLMKRR